jgi:hypothetical protein|nr:hypothetical protein [uncultured Acetatifactor sp.]
MGDENMYEALMEMIEPRIQQREKAEIEAERKKGFVWLSSLFRI